MTKFVADALGVRKAATGYSSKNRKRDMDAFLETGVRFLLEKNFKTDLFLFSVATAASTIVPYADHILSDSFTDAS
jgi:hypothetical protein